MGTKLVKVANVTTLKTPTPASAKIQHGYMDSFHKSGLNLDCLWQSLGMQYAQLFRDWKSLSSQAMHLWIVKALNLFTARQFFPFVIHNTKLIGFCLFHEHATLNGHIQKLWNYHSAMHPNVTINWRRSLHALCTTHHRSRWPRWPRWHRLQWWGSKATSGTSMRMKWPTGCGHCGHLWLRPLRWHSWNTWRLIKKSPEARLVRCLRSLWSKRTQFSVETAVVGGKRSWRTSSGRQHRSPWRAGVTRIAKVIRMNHGFEWRIALPGVHGRFSDSGKSFSIGVLSQNQAKQKGMSTLRKWIKLNKVTSRNRRVIVQYLVRSYTFCKSEEVNNWNQMWNLEYLPGIKKNTSFLKEQKTIKNAQPSWLSPSKTSDLWL